VGVLDEALDERKLKILKAIIQNYLETGEPVGSRTIYKYTDLNLSSATIRNEMADLEEAGYILQPHTSAGRIPSDKGYRLYVDHMMEEREQSLREKEAEVDGMKEGLLDRMDRLENMLESMAKSLAVNTNYAAMITTPKYTMNRIKFIQLSIVEPTKLLCVIVTQSKLIKNKILEIPEEINNEDLLKLNVMLNTSLAGLTLEEINLAMISQLTGQAGNLNHILRDVIDAITEAFDNDENLEIYTSGATNIFKYPELSDKENASKLISTLEEKKVLAGLLTDSMNGDSDTGIQVYIGDETPVQSMKDCSVVTATYEIEDGVKGTIGIIGPKRMDYEKVVETLNTVKKQLGNAYKKAESDET
jgi:heat-inducible transcriptional repressor